MSYIEWVRSRVGHQKIFLVFATVIVLDDNGRILVQKRSDFSFWGLPGGVMELDEDIQMTAVREVREETGLEIERLQLVGVYTDPKYDVVYPNGDAVQQFTICFSAQACGGEMRPDGEEILFNQFLPAEDVLKLDLPIWYRDMMIDYLNEQRPTFRDPFCGKQIVDQITSIRPLIGTQKLIAVGGSAIIQNEAGAILLVQRQDDGAWVFPAGYSEIGENVAFTIVREVKEETNLTVYPSRLIGVFSDPFFHHIYPNGDRVQNVGILFKCELIRGEIELERAELRSYQWVSPNQLPHKIGPNYRRYGEKIVAHLDKGAFVF